MKKVEKYLTTCTNTDQIQSERTKKEHIPWTENELKPSTDHKEPVYRLNMAKMQVKYLLITWTKYVRIDYKYVISRTKHVHKNLQNWTIKHYGPNTKIKLMVKNCLFQGATLPNARLECRCAKQKYNCSHFHRRELMVRKCVLPILVSTTVFSRL